MVGILAHILFSLCVCVHAHTQEKGGGEKENVNLIATTRSLRKCTNHFYFMRWGLYSYFPAGEISLNALKVLGENKEINTMFDCFWIADHLILLFLLLTEDQHDLC